MLVLRCHFEYFNFTEAADGWIKVEVCKNEKSKMAGSFINSFDNKIDFLLAVKSIKAFGSTFINGNVRCLV